MRARLLLRPGLITKNMRVDLAEAQKPSNDYVSRRNLIVYRRDRYWPRRNRFRGGEFQ